MHQLAVDVCADGGRGAVEDSAAVEILGVTRPIPGPLLAPDPGVAILCNQRNADYTPSGEDSVYSASPLSSRRGDLHIA